jgi:TRAP-type mannitol/chloroaromatic compound transport system permease small subunit
VGVPPRALVCTIQGLDTFTDWCGKAVAWLVVPMAAGLTYEVVARYVFDAPTEWAFDVTYMLYGSHFMLVAAYTLMRGGHIRTDMLYARFSARTQGAIDVVGYVLFFFPAVIFLLVAGTDAAVASWEMGERSEISPWRPPLYPLKAVIPVTAVLLLVQGLSELLKSVYAVMTARLYAEREEVTA